MNFFTAFFNSLPGAVDQGLVWAIMAIGLFISFKILDFADLTVDGSFATGGCVCAILVTNGVNIFLALLIALIAGALCGLVTGILHTYLGIPGILAGILTQLMLWSINLKILGRANVAVNSQKHFLVINQLNIWPTMGIMVGIIALIIVALYWFFGTEYGASIRCVGSNPRMAAANGINVKNKTIAGLMISNALVAFSGAMLCQYQGFADINMGRGAIVIGLAAIIVGLAVVSKISRNFAFTLTGVALGGVIYYIVYQLVINLGLDTDLLKLLSAAIVAVFLAIPYCKKTYFSRIKKAKKEEVATATETEGGDE